MVEVKICGLKTEAALDAALEAGADYVGFVLFAKSPRNISLETARALIRRAHERSHAKAVALLVDPDEAFAAEVARVTEADIVQLHGKETPERVESIVRTIGSPLWKAVSVATAEDVEAAARYFAPGRRADLILFDAKPPPDPAALPGGNGLSFDWRILTGAERSFPFALAGGLTPETVADAVRLTHPAVVDVSSGVETSPGMKDEALIRRFIRNAKAAKQHA